MSLPRLAKPIRAAWFISAGVIVAVAASGCDGGKFSHKRAGASTPRETFELLRECRNDRTYAAMRPYLHASGREGMVDLLVAVDELVLANAAAREAAQRACPGAAIPYDVSGIQDWLEIFSRDVSLVDVAEKGDQATVTVQIGTRLPVVSTHFVRAEGVWQYVPAPDQMGVVRAIRQLTHALNQIEISLSSPVTPEQVREEYQLRLGPKLKAFEELQGQSSSREVATVYP